MAIDVSAASYESGRRALQLAADGGSSSLHEIASLLVQEAEDHRNSSSLKPWHLSPLDSDDEDRAISCEHRTALEVAASAGDMDAVERLLAAGADPNVPVHEGGISALEAAAAQGQLIVVKKLLEIGAHPDHHGECSGSTPLIAAVRAGHIEICEALLQSGADVSILAGVSTFWEGRTWPTSESTAIEAAADTLSAPLVKLFLGVVEDRVKELDHGNLTVAMTEGPQEDSGRLLRNMEFLARTRKSITRAFVAVAPTGNMLIIQGLLDAGADITNAIAAAASRGQLEVVIKLLQTASDRNILAEPAVTKALQSAVSAGATALIEPLLQAGADATSIDIREAAEAGHLDTLESILQSGATVELEIIDRISLVDATALQLAAYEGHQAIVDLLLANGADVNQCAIYWHDTHTEGVTALQSAVARGHLAVTQQLIDVGADVNGYSQDGDTPLQAAVRTGDEVMLELLLAAGADVDVVVGRNPQEEQVPGKLQARPREKTALSVAAGVGNADLVARLLSLMSPECARQAAPWALQKAAENRHADIVRQLLQMHPDVNMSLGKKRSGGSEELTSLQTAATDGNLEILKTLISEGADVNLNPSEGWQPTALQSASKRGNLAAVKLLLAAGAEVDVTGSTAPPLLLAIRGGHVQVFEHLLAAGADIHGSSYLGQTMQEAAEDSGDTDIQGRVRAALNSRPPPQIDQPLDRATGSLCGTCQLKPLVELFCCKESRCYLHPSLTALRASAAAGCPFCYFVWKRLGITSISIPQPSPVELIWYGGIIICWVEEPFPSEKDRPRHLRAEVPFFLPDSDWSTRVPITEDTSSPETYNQIQSWLETCKSQHARCRAPGGNSSLPARLIYLDTSREPSLSNLVDVTSLQPRLVSTNGMDRSECRYIALSYRWPEDFPVEAKSNRDNLSQQMRGLNTAKLPQIFKDVFQVAARMGISYVWIDSLCIIQDELEDWDRESALMLQVYRYAEFTVASAAPPTKPDLGLFRHGDPSDPPSVAPFGVRDPEDNETGQDLVLMKPQKDWEAYQDSPLVSRGWCFQEREISQRILHYTETQVLWECRTLQASEGLPHGGPDRVDPRWWKERMLDRELEHLEDPKVWQAAVADYSARDLSRFTDKLTALSGLAAVIGDCKPAKCRYLAGLWEDNFLSDLQWRTADPDFEFITNTRYPGYVAPTWSWASVAGPVEYYRDVPDRRHPTNHDANAPKYVLKVLDVYVQTSTNDPFGAVGHATLTCTAGLVPGWLRETYIDSHQYDVISPHGVPMGVMDFDVRPEIRHKLDFDVIFCIHLGHQDSIDSDPGLAILPTGNNDNEYIRVGMIRSLKTCEDFFDAEIKEITII